MDNNDNNNRDRILMMILISLITALMIWCAIKFSTYDPLVLGNYQSWDLKYTKERMRYHGCLVCFRKDGEYYFVRYVKICKL